MRPTKVYRIDARTLRPSEEVMPRNKQFPPTTHYKIHDYQTDSRDLEKAKASFQKEKRQPFERVPEKEKHVTESEAELLRTLEKQKHNR